MSADSIDVQPSYATIASAENYSTVAGEELLTNQDLETAEESTVKGATSQEALFNCVNILLGCGVLSIPYALEEGGWAAFAVLGLMWIATNYTGMYGKTLPQGALLYCFGVWHHRCHCMQCARIATTSGSI